MKKAILALCLTGVLLLCGCSAMLERPYVAVEDHPEHPGADTNASTVTVKNYAELVDAVLYFVVQAREEGNLLLVDYDGDISTDLNAACLEVAREDPLGAYAVDFIQAEYTRVLTTYEATLSITYRRTPEQIRSLVNVTGASAIRQVLGTALAEFRTEVALQVGYFAEDEEYIRTLVRQAYYDTPAAAMGMPEVSISIYPDEGRRRIVEIVLHYDRSVAELQKQSLQTAAIAEGVTGPLQDLRGNTDQIFTELLQRASAALKHRAERDDGTPANTAWDALVGRGGDPEGIALALALLSDQLSLPCDVQEGTRNGERHFWNAVVGVDGETYYVDLSREEELPRIYSEADLHQRGYAWGEPAAEEGTDPAPEETLE